jgi:hypothetical protein
MGRKRTKKTKAELDAEPCRFTVARAPSRTELRCQHGSHRAIIVLPGREDSIRESLINAGYEIDPVEIKE